ncbi:hypothetical protein HBI56_078000 [Parastagonospora nodorum]|uniref:Uncharacterized protein n=2 Tax=Phaeosphaeria nodorum (strain SN15 / ATCC MYA-4574 / FGSC 10173) TaxID=321614 RepID=A0A7U2EW24_PHANO|nr:hypothetical protein SNOG_07439 [Parastagonospora nodorum SN15]KAH3910248.1 hypothetical protein HBH56_149180 [Parastagonospora nodorum]EAT84905.1 hypothetical protein SNOG_07439 [Parastagonospora nodorum SN15]KAH3923247.1 hypothetical protein HBH54_213820 [Parastagonospora nodorum]KAH3946093.1 hypothetical protein HBH53_136620 [Parastagonospora nodorum]KAH3985912.1 hypothetical protein HBH51_022150 [Parastagonospora nodorum]
MKSAIFSLAVFLASALAAPAPQQGPDAWFPDVWSCRCHSQAQDLPVIQPICSSFGGNDMTIYPPAQPDPYLGRFVWCQKTSLKSAQKENRMAGVFNDAACQKQFGADFKADCQVFGYALCFGEEEC